MSKQLTRLKDCNLIKVSKKSTDDGDFTEELSNVGVYSVITQELTDAVSATIYGGNVSKMVRISSVHRLLEILLKSKMNNAEDNISKYRITFNNSEYYKIVDVKTKYIDIERI